VFTKIVIVLVVAVVAFLAYVATKPDKFRIARTQTINAAPEEVFGLINDLRRFNTWNPFALADPLIKINYIGAATGAGASFDWDSVGKAGRGRIEITEAAAPFRVSMQLEFIKPFAATNSAEFTLIPEGRTTRVTWAMTGRIAYPHKLMGTIFNMDKMVGGEFANGLANLKALAENQQKTVHSGDAPKAAI
jgi:carbon monoxide dehydrogenase subunit G